MIRHRIALVTLETEVNAAPGEEIFIRSFNASTDLVAQNPVSGIFAPIDVAGNCSIHGFAGIKEIDNMQVPEPTTIGLLGLGLAGSQSRLRKAAKARTCGGPEENHQ